MIESLIKQTKQFVPEACDGNYNRTPHPSPRYNVDASWVRNIVAGEGWRAFIVSIEGCCFLEH